MISTPSLHPFFSHFPGAMFAAGCVLLYLGKKNNKPVLYGAASLNFTFGLLATVLAGLTGMLASDLGLRQVSEVEGHQGYAFAMLLTYVAGTVFCYTQKFSQGAKWVYAGNFFLLVMTYYSGYLLVFRSAG